MNKPSVCVSFSKSKGLNTECGTHLSASLGKGWTMEWLDNVMTHSWPFCLSALLNTASASPWGFLCASRMATCSHHWALWLFIHIRGGAREWGQGREEETDAFPRCRIKAFSSDWLARHMSFTPELPYMRSCALSEFLNQWLVGKEDWHNPSVPTQGEGWGAVEWRLWSHPQHPAHPQGKQCGWGFLCHFSQTLEAFYQRRKAGKGMNLWNTRFRGPV